MPWNPLFHRDRRADGRQCRRDPEETRQGKTVNAATLDLCYPAEKNSDRKDRFVVNLTSTARP